MSLAKNKPLAGMFGVQAQDTFFRCPTSTSLSHMRLLSEDNHETQGSQKG